MLKTTCHCELFKTLNFGMASKLSFIISFNFSLHTHLRVKNLLKNLRASRFYLHTAQIWLYVSFFYRSCADMYHTKTEPKLISIVFSNLRLFHVQLFSLKTDTPSPRIKQVVFPLQRLLSVGALTTKLCLAFQQQYKQHSNVSKCEHRKCECLLCIQSIPTRDLFCEIWEEWDGQRMKLNSRYYIPNLAINSTYYVPVKSILQGASKKKKKPLTPTYSDKI